MPDLTIRFLNARVSNHVVMINADFPGIRFTAARISDDLFENDRTVEHDRLVKQELFRMCRRDKVIERVEFDKSDDHMHTYIVDPLGSLVG